MPTFRMAALLAVAAFPAWAQDAPDDVLDVVVTRKLDEARQRIEPSLGATTTSFSREALEAIPQGDDSQLNQVLLQAPGVAEDSFGQVHLRGEHADIQYRINGVQLPEGLSVFGQAIESRLAGSLSLLTGALPAQYGFNTAGVVDIQTKSGTANGGGDASVYGGSFGWVQPSFDYGGKIGSFDWFLTGDYLQNKRGIENPAPTYGAIHDQTQQFHGLGYFSDIVDEDTRISAVLGAFHGDFQIPNNPGQVPTLGLNVDGVTSYDSSALNEHQRELTDFGVLSLQKHAGDVDFQLSGFTRYSSLYFTPDPIGDLLFNGIAQTAARSDWASGAQGDLAWRIDDAHTLRTGFQIQGERTTYSTASSVLALDAAGVQTSDLPETIRDSGGKTGALYGVYLQDEWRITPEVTLNYGGRFDVIDQYTHENQASPRINVVWQPTEATVAHAGFAQYFQAPPFELVSAGTIGLFAGTSAAPAVRLDSIVKAERSDYYDAGVSQTAAPGLIVGFDGYYKAASHLIDEGQFGAPIILTAFNYEHSETAGAQLTASWDRGPWSVYGNLAYSRAIGREIISAQFNFLPDELAYIAGRYIHLDHDQRWSSSGGIAYTIDKGGRQPTRLSADYVVGSGLRASTATIPNGVALKGYATVNLSAAQTLDLGIGRGTVLRLDVLNVGDATYEIRNGTGVGVGAPQYGTRRAFLAGVTQLF
jgi:hypothetical protein